MLTRGSTSSNSQSRLLTLPRELRDQIYNLVCGSNILHFKFASSHPVRKGDLCHYICLSKVTEEEAQASFESSKSAWFDEANASRHEECYSPKIFSDVSGRVSRRLTLDLRFLRTSRQIYHEARLFCYTATTFSFNEWDVLARFVKTVSWVPCVRSIRLRIRSGAKGDKPPACEALQNISSRLTGLQRIHIDVVQFCSSGSREYDRRAEEASHLTQQLLSFAGPALKAAAVVISDARFTNSETTQWSWYMVGWSEADYYRWTMTQKQEYAKFLQNALLQHKSKS